jgi:hypothetical protein
MVEQAGHEPPYEVRGSGAITELLRELQRQAADLRGHDASSARSNDTPARGLCLLQRLDHFIE